jgi:hypothetical protein
LAHINLNLASITQGADSDCESRHIQIAHGFFSQLGDVQANNPGVVSTTNIANIYPKYHGVTDAPGLAWQDPDDLEFVSVGDIPPKLRIVWTMPSLQGRKMFLVSELAYYLRGPAMMAAAMKARQAELEKRAEIEREGLTLESTWHTGYQVWQEVLKKESADLSKMWAAADADAFGQVLLRAFEVADRLRFCPTPNCPAPYFIAQRRSQKYCSDACSLPAQRECKRIWWREHGAHARRRTTTRRTRSRA